jgi:dienelactone hydrolase
MSVKKKILPLRFFQKHGFKVIGSLVLFLLIFLSIPQGRALTKALLTTPELINNSPIRPLRFFTSEPIVNEVSFKSRNQPITADLYLPQKRGRFPAVVLDLGLDIDKKDPRVQKIAEAFARNGLIVLAPNIPSLTERRLTINTKEDLISAFEYLETQNNVKKDKIGIIGFCTSGGIALLAAEDPQIRDKVDFILTVNPYFDLKSLYKALTLREVEDQKWTPHFKSVEVYNRETILLLKNANDIVTLTEHLVRIPPEDLSNGNFPQLTKKEKGLISSDALFVYDGLTNKDPKKADYYLENASSSQKEFLKNVSPSTEINKLKAKTFIFADKNFTYIPYTEGILLRDALPDNQYVYSETSILPTTQLASGLSLKNYAREGYKVLSFLYSFFREST